MTWLCQTCLTFQFHLSLFAICPFMIDSTNKEYIEAFSGITTSTSVLEVRILVLDILEPFFRSSDFRGFVPLVFRILLLSSIRINLRLQQRAFAYLSF